MKLRDGFVRDKQSSVLLERFLIASVTSVVMIRCYLAVTGYPQVGGRGLHIAHLLWGGLGMLVALVLSLAFLGRRERSTVALLGGIGFGTFIDELGKFITSDNNYFFRPTLTIIYIIFIVLLLSFRILESLPYVSEQERMVNALHILEEGVQQGLCEPDKKEILFATIISIFFIVYMLLFTCLTAIGIMNPVVGSLLTGGIKIGWFASSFLSYAMIMIGVLSVRRSRVAAYIWFKRSLFVSIFLTQVFLLSTQPLGALVALLVNLIVLAVLDRLIRNHSLDLQNKELVQSDH